MDSSPRFSRPGLQMTKPAPFIDRFGLWMIAFHCNLAGVGVDLDDAQHDGNHREKYEQQGDNLQLHQLSSARTFP